MNCSVAFFYDLFLACGGVEKVDGFFLVCGVDYGDAVFGEVKHCSPDGLGLDVAVFVDDGHVAFYDDEGFWVGVS